MAEPEVLKRQVDPESVPKWTLNSGCKIPCLGLGTFGSDAVSPATIADTVKGAIRAGYRHIDCASVYGNEKNIGDALSELSGNGSVRREELWITSKVWNDMHDRVAESCRRSLKDLQLEYLDLYLVHWPLPNYHPSRCDVGSRSPNAKPYIHEKYMETWRQMERLVEEGLVRHIGTSNMTIPKLMLLLRDATLKPACNEMELHPHFQQQELLEYCTERGIQPIAYCPLGSPGRPERDRTPEDTVDLEDEVILSIAAQLEISPAQVALKWALQRGQIPIPFSVHHFVENLESVVGAQLTGDDMVKISKIDRNCRLIKGQVFLWKENQTWEDLWDPGGTITPG